MKKLWIDDIRNPLDENWIIARTSKEAINYIMRNGLPDIISFDHDLGGEDTSMEVVKFIINDDLDKNSSELRNFKFFVHSANPVGAKNISETLNGYLRYIKENES